MPFHIIPLPPNTESLETIGVGRGNYDSDFSKFQFVAESGLLADVSARALAARMKRTTKILLVLGAIIVLAPVVFFVLLDAVWREHGKHDQVIVGTKELHFAVYEYSERNGHAPSDLASLVPDFIPSIPQFPSGARLVYHVSQSGKEWTVDVVWIRKNGPLVFRRTNAQLSPEDAARQVGSENGCYILKER